MRLEDRSQLRASLAKEKERSAALKKQSERLMQENERLRQALVEVRHDLRAERANARKISRLFNPAWRLQHLSR